MTPLEQARVFAAMLCCGACLGMIYDALGMLRRVRGMCVMTDMLFGLCCATGMILTALYLQVDPFRLYVFGAAACGMALYEVTVGTVIRRMAAIAWGRLAKWEEKCKKRADAAGD